MINDICGRTVGLANEAGPYLLFTYCWMELKTCLSEQTKNDVDKYNNARSSKDLVQTLCNGAVRYLSPDDADAPSHNDLRFPTGEGYSHRLS